ncbi:MAG: TIM barrel protein [Planctomycetes bacterium]|nr:TIM barrel protein [Planctomycetota bacterium]
MQQSLKDAFPFRMGATSYVWPADILPNLNYLQHRVDDVELVLFESDEFSNMPSDADVNAMVALKNRAGLTYTVHLPLDTRLGSDEESERAISVGKCRRVIDRMGPVEPFAWILHLHGDHRGDPPSADMPRWLSRNRRSLAEMLDGGPAPRTVCVETLDYDLELAAALIEEFDLAVCVDIGHLLVNRRDVAQHLDRWWQRTRVLHVHGVTDSGKDHVHCGHLPPGLLEAIADRLCASPLRTRVMTMEVFGMVDFKRSVQAVAERLARWRK